MPNWVLKQLFFRYRTQKSPGNVPGIGSIANEFKYWVESCERSSFEEYIIIAHSLGGLIAKDYVIRSLVGKGNSKIAKLYLIATPNDGVGKTYQGLIGILSTLRLANLHVVQASGYSDFQKRQNDLWQETITSTDTSNYFGKRFGIDSVAIFDPLDELVSEESAKYGGHRAYPLEHEGGNKDDKGLMHSLKTMVFGDPDKIFERHIGIVKPKTKNNQVLEFIAAELKQLDCLGGSHVVRADDDLVSKIFANPKKSKGYLPQNAFDGNRRTFWSVREVVRPAAKTTMSVGIEFKVPLTVTEVIAFPDYCCDPKGQKTHHRVLLGSDVVSEWTRTLDLELGPNHPKTPYGGAIPNTIPRKSIIIETLNSGGSWYGWADIKVCVKG